MNKLAKFQVEKLLESVSDSIVALDANWRYTYVNEKAAQTFGRTREQLIGKHIWTEFPEGVGQPFYKAYYKAVETQQPIFLEEYYPPYDRWFENRIYPSDEGLTILFHDITDHKKAEIAVQESERRFREMLENVQLIAILLDLEGHVTFCNEFLLQLTGYTRDEVLGCDWFAQFVPDVRADVKETFLQGLKRGEMAAHYENPIRTKNGTERFIRFSNTILRDAQGMIIGTTSLGEDITERKQAEEELQRNEQIFRLFVEHSPAAIAMFDRDMKYIVASRRYLIDYDLKDQEVVGRSHYEIFPEMPERWKEIHRRCLAGATEKNEEDPFPRASGKTDWVRWEIRPWYERTGEIGGIILFSEVVTESKRVAEALRENEERYRLLFHRSPIGVVQYDGNLRVIDCNERFLQILRTSREKVIGLDIHNLRDQGGLPAFQKSLTGEEGFAEDLYQATTSDARAWLTTRTAPLFDPAGNVRGGVAIIEDITERKQAEGENRRYLNQLTALNKAALELQTLHSPQVLAGEIIKSLEMILDYTYSAVLLIEEATGRLTPFALSAQRHDESFVKQDKRYIESVDIHVGQGVTGWVAQTGRNVRLGNVRQDERYLGVRDDICSELCVPLKAGERVIGVINIESVQPDAYSESDERVLETVAAQITVSIQNARLLEETRLSRDRLADLSKKLVEVHEAESRAIGRELHDQIGQMLTALKLALEIASQLPPELREKKNRQTQELVNDLLKRVSALSLELRPPMLDDLGLIPALLWHINRFEEQTGIAVGFKHSGAEGRRFSAEVETTAYRVIQEAFTNIARHARAGRTRLEVHAGSGRMKIQIEDDGAGFDPQAAFEKHRGLGGMRERIGLLNGTFRVESQTGKGTALLIELPLKENA